MGETNSSHFPVVSSDEILSLEEAQHSPSLVFLSGIHAIKHAVRFGAEILCIASTDTEKSLGLCASLAPDILKVFSGHLRSMDRSQMKSIHPNRLHWTEVWGVAKRPHVDLSQLFLQKGRTSPLVILENPKNLGNLGASIRTASGLGASGLVVLGEADPWSPRVVQAASGTQFALPVGRVALLPPYLGEFIVCDPEGEDISRVNILPNTIFLFGTEREGVSGMSDLGDAKKVRIPMKEGLSSLNLAVSVGIVLSHSIRTLKEAP